MRPSERRAATEAVAAVPDLPNRECHWLEVHVPREQFDRARDALMYWEIGNSRSRATIETSDIPPDDVRRALTDDVTGPIECYSIVVKGVEEVRA